MFFRMVYKSGQIFLPFCHNTRVWQTDRQTDRQTDGQTDGQTDRQTDRILIAIPRLHCMQRGKNLHTHKNTIQKIYYRWLNGGIQPPLIHNPYILFIYYATKAAQENTNIQTYKTYKKKTREAIRNKTTMKLQICSHRSGKRMCHCTFDTVSRCSRPDTIFTA